jgi:hypothetical protein
MYEVLLTLYIRGRDEEGFYRLWETYHPVVHFSSAFRLLSQLRWLVIKGEYKDAEQLLQEYCAAEKWQRGFSQHRATVLLDIIRVKLHSSTADVAGTYSTFQMRQLERLTHQKRQPAASH